MRPIRNECCVHFSFLASTNMSLEKSHRCTILVQALPAPERCVGDLFEDMFWKSKLQNQVKCDVYLDIWLIGPIWTIKHICW